MAFSTTAARRRGVRTAAVRGVAATTTLPAETARLARAGVRGSGNGREPPRLADDFGDTDAELLIHPDHFASGDQCAVHGHVDRLASQLVQLDDAARAQGQDVA